MRITINEGTTYEQLPAGLIIFILGGIICAIPVPFIWILGIAVLVLGVGIMGMKTGFEVDPGEKRMRKYKQILWVRRGEYRSLSHVIQAELVMKRHEPVRMAANGNLISWRKEPRPTTTYDLILTDDASRSKTANQFMKYTLGQKTLKAIGECEWITIDDKVGRLLKQQRANRRR